MFDGKAKRRPPEWSNWEATVSLLTLRWHWKVLQGTNTNTLAYSQLQARLEPIVISSLMVGSYPPPSLARIYQAGNTKGGSIIVPLASCLAGLESVVWLLTIFVFICKTDYSKPVKPKVNSTVILPPLVFPDSSQSESVWQWPTL